MASSELTPITNGSPTRHPLNSLTGQEGESVQDLRRVITELSQVLPGDLRRITVSSGDREIEIEWSFTPTAADATVTGSTLRTKPAEQTRPQDAAAPTTAAEGAGSVAVRAPLVGTYFAAPAPEADPFVTVGDQVESGATIAIVEAMKMMNPIVAPQSGVVAELPVPNGEPVEYDQILVLITPFEVSAEQRR